jgi:hypothetical protein
MRVIELTMTGSAVQITPNVGANQTTPIYVTHMLVQPATTAATVGDNTVTATKGIVIASGVAQLFTFAQPRGSLLSQYWIIGTNGNKVEVLYETAE